MVCAKGECKKETLYKEKQREHKIIKENRAGKSPLPDLGRSYTLIPAVMDDCRQGVT